MSQFVMRYGGTDVLSVEADILYGRERMLVGKTIPHRKEKLIDLQCDSVLQLPIMPLPTLITHADLFLKPTPVSHDFLLVSKRPVGKSQRKSWATFP